MTLTAKLVALVVGLTAAILAAVFFLLSGAWGGWSAEVVDRDLRDRAAALAARLELEHGGLEVEDEHELPALRDPAHPWRVVGPGGPALGDAALPWPAPDLAATAPAAATVADAGGRRWRVVTAVAEVEGEGRGAARVAVQVAGDAAPHAALEDRFRRGLLLALLGTLAVGAIAAAALASLSLAPLRRLAAEVDRIGATSLDRRVRAAGLDPELSRVATAFNGLLGRLDEAMQRQRQLVSRASHSLRTPVATILTRAEVALRRERDPAAYREALSDVAQAAREASALVGHLLTLSSLDERRGAVALEDVPLAEVAREIVRLLAPRAAEAGVALELDVPDGAVARADRRAVRELAEALLDNAVHHTPRGGRAGVRAAPAPGGLALTVWDTGPGIPADERDKVLERFYRGRDAQASGRPGSGLGLAIVKAIADAHGAPLSLGDRPGGGLEVTVVLATPGARAPGLTAGGGAALPR